MDCAISFGERAAARRGMRGRQCPEPSDFAARCDARTAVGFSTRATCKMCETRHTPHKPCAIPAPGRLPPRRNACDSCIAVGFSGFLAQRAKCATQNRYLGPLPYARCDLHRWRAVPAAAPDTSGRALARRIILRLISDTKSWRNETKCKSRYDCA